MMKEAMLKAFKDLKKLPSEEFEKKIESRSDGDIAKSLYELGFIPGDMHGRVKEMEGSGDTDFAKISEG